MLKLSNRLVFCIGSKMHAVRQEEIICLSADSNYTNVITADKKHLIATTMGKLEKQLSPDNFIRVHKSHIVNVDFIQSYDKNTNTLDVGFEVPVSRSMTAEIKEMF